MAAIVMNSNLVPFLKDYGVPPSLSPDDWSLVGIDDYRWFYLTDAGAGAKDLVQYDLVFYCSVMQLITQPASYLQWSDFLGLLGPANCTLNSVRSFVHPSLPFRAHCCVCRHVFVRLLLRSNHASSIKQETAISAKSLDWLISEVPRVTSAAPRRLLLPHVTLLQRHSWKANCLLDALSNSPARMRTLCRCAAEMCTSQPTTPQHPIAQSALPVSWTSHRHFQGPSGH
jgi:hypothetical protein